MIEDKASHTAERMALHRAAHQLLDHPPVLEDPLALAMLGRDKAAALIAKPSLAESSPASRFLRAFAAARSRLAEDQLAAGLEHGVGQYVILGAGLDTFAYRNPHPPEALRVFEVDHPATQAWKRERLAQAGIAAPPELSYAPVDFHEQTLASGLEAAGFDPGVPSLFAWLGVTPYLTLEAIKATLGYIAACPPGSGVVLDYPQSPEVLDMRGRLAYKALAGFSAAAGEPWLTNFAPAEMTALLDELGFSLVKDLGKEQINERYFAGRSDGLMVGDLYHLATAWV
ncbi:MAG: class I SAM-dependent methyltransferase [Desulfarculaceae bacterium]|nr:class I SAM-dependent methyltransferase [Desulfarculaceae bacterium]